MTAPGHAAVHGHVSAVLALKYADGAVGVEAEQLAARKY